MMLIFLGVKVFREEIRIKVYFNMKYTKDFLVSIDDILILTWLLIGVESYSRFDYHW